MRQEGSSVCCLARVLPCCRQPSSWLNRPFYCPACSMVEQQAREAAAKERHERRQAERSADDVEEEELQKASRAVHLGGPLPVLVLC